MACHFPLSSPLSTKPIKSHKITLKPCSYPSISCIKPDPNPESKDENHKINGSRFNYLSIPVTLTVISAYLAPLPVLAATAAAKAGNKKKTQRKTQQETLTPEQLKQWYKDLPIVSNRMPYTDILSLHEAGRLKYVIKAPRTRLKEGAEAVMVVLDDNQVFRTVLPSLGSNEKFWESWDELKLDSLCFNAYTPPVNKAELPKPYLGFLWKFSEFMLSRFKPKKETKRAKELKMAREKLKRQREDELEKVKEERDMLGKAMQMQKKEQRRREKIKPRIKKSKVSSKETAAKGHVWVWLAKDRNVTTGLGLLFFLIFYQTVVLSYKKQRKDYEDRLKIEKAEAEERKKMKQLEREVSGFVEVEEGEQGKGEQNPYLQMAKLFMKSGARVRSARNKRLPQYLDRNVDVTFSDVAGLGKIRLELEEIVKFFTHGEMYRRRGVKIPGGVLLCGPPGVGKTLLAKAVAGEAGVNFFSISASQFVEIYVGVGASRVRALYQEARENAPSVVFIDELDAVGRERGLIKGSGGRERDATLNQLLVCLDGFEGRGEVITVASTNRPDILDPALVRPGRFDRKIMISKPGFLGRMEILKVHACKKPMSDDVDYPAVASITDGMAGAELANLIEVAALNMMRDGRTEIATDDLLQAVQIEERGLLDRKERSPEMWKQVAINEAAMAVVAVNFPDLRNIEFVTISPRAGRELGYVRLKLDRVKFTEGFLSRQCLLDHITLQLAPRAADELWCGEGQLSTIWAETANNARSAARTYVLGGLSEQHHGISRFWVADRIDEIDSEALQILHSCYDRAKKILQQNRKLMDAVVDELAQKKSLSKQEFFRLVELHGSIQPMPQSIVEIRAAKRAEFQETMMKQKETTTSNV
nr:AAA-type ATPase family protein [Passiflora contracta]